MIKVIYAGFNKTRWVQAEMAIKIRKGFRELLDEANAEVNAIAADEAQALYGRDDIVFVDLRDPRERTREGSIPGAFSCPRGMLEFWIDPDSPCRFPFNFANPTSTISVHCPST